MSEKRRVVDGDEWTFLNVQPEAAILPTIVNRHCSRSMDPRPERSAIRHWSVGVFFHVAEKPLACHHVSVSPRFCFTTFLFHHVSDLRISFQGESEVLGQPSRSRWMFTDRGSMLLNQTRQRRGMGPPAREAKSTDLGQNRLQRPAIPRLLENERTEHDYYLLRAPLPSLRLDPPKGGCVCDSARFCFFGGGFAMTENFFSDGVTVGATRLVLSS